MDMVGCRRSGGRPIARPRCRRWGRQQDHRVHEQAVAGLAERQDYPEGVLVMVHQQFGAVFIFAFGGGCNVRGSDFI